MNLLKRIWIPSAVLLFFILTLLLRDTLLNLLFVDNLEKARLISRYLIESCIWLSGAYLCNRLITILIWEGLIGHGMGLHIPRLLRDVTSVLIFFIALSGIYGFVFDKSVTGIWATSGVVGLILGFALRSIILDAFVGLAVNFEQPYRIGDWIKVHKVGVDDYLIGQIKEINWRTTRIKTIENNIVVVPNSTIGSSVVTNFMQPDKRGGFFMLFCLDFSVPSERAIRVLTAGAKAATEKGILADPEPIVRINHIDNLGVEYMVRYWIIPEEVSPQEARHYVIESILKHLSYAGLTPAYPKEDLYYAAMPTRQLTGKSVDEKITLLSHIDLFEPMARQELKLLATQMKHHLFQCGDMIIQQEEAGESMFILFEGLLDVYIDFSEDNKGVHVGQITPGECFGEMSLLTGEARSATIRAVTDAVAYEITKDQMEAIFEKRPAIVEQLGAKVAHRRLLNSEAFINASEQEKAQQKENLSQHISDKIKNFFHTIFEPNRVSEQS